MAKSRKSRARKNDKNRKKRTANRRPEGCLLYRKQPQFAPYEEWFHISESGALGQAPGLDAEARDLLERLLTLGPLYDGVVPLAAVYLDDQIREGHVYMAMPSDPDGASVLPVAQLAADMGNPELVAGLASAHPGVGLEPAEMDTQQVRAALHRLHAQGLFVMDDVHRLHVDLVPVSLGAVLPV